MACNSHWLEKTLLRFPNLESEFNTDLNNTSIFDLDFTQITVSRDKFWWTCEKKHDWESTFANRIKDKKGRGCPFCSSQKLGADNNLEFVNPDLCKEWDYEKNYPLMPSQVMPWTKRRVWWLCPNGHSYKTRIMHRMNGHQCSKCSLRVSRPEIRLYTELKSIVPAVLWSCTVGKISCDIFFPHQKVVVHYDGVRWHKSKVEKDKNNVIQLESQGIYNIRVREYGLPRLFSTDILLDAKEEGLSVVKKVIVGLLKSEKFSKKENKSFEYYLEESILRNNEEYLTLVSNLPKPLLEKSLASTHPHLCLEWHPDKNHPITPEHVTFGSDKKVWWLCHQGHEWKVAVKARGTIMANGCPYCSNKVIGKYNNLELTHPHIFAEWDLDKNLDIEVKSISKSSEKKVWWKCSKQHSWEQRVSLRVSGFGCPKCHKSFPVPWTAEEERILLSNYSTVLCVENLSDLIPSHTLNAIKSRANRLGLYRQDNERL